jgi:hypothetical protein
LCYLAQVYTNLLITKQPLELYFKPRPDGFPDRVLRVSPDILPPAAQLGKALAEGVGGLGALPDDLAEARLHGNLGDGGEPAAEDQHGPLLGVAEVADAPRRGLDVVAPVELAQVGGHLEGAVGREVGALVRAGPGVEARLAHAALPAAAASAARFAR